MKKALCLIFAVAMALLLFGCRVNNTDRARRAPIVAPPYTTTRTVPRPVVPRTDTRRDISAAKPRMRRAAPYYTAPDNARVGTVNPRTTTTNTVR